MRGPPAFAPVDVRTQHTADFTATLRLVDLGIVRVAAATSPPLEAHGRPGPRRPHHSGFYMLVLNRSGDITVANKQRAVTLAPEVPRWSSRRASFRNHRSCSPAASRGMGRRILS